MAKYSLDTGKTGVTVGSFMREARQVKVVKDSLITRGRGRFSGEGNLIKC